MCVTVTVGAPRYCWTILSRYERSMTIQNNSNFFSALPCWTKLYMTETSLSYSYLTVSYPTWQRLLGNDMPLLSLRASSAVRCCDVLYTQWNIYSSAVPPQHVHVSILVLTFFGCARAHVSVSPLLVVKQVFRYRTVRWIIIVDACRWYSLLYCSR
jgi:hypothetical protein